MNLGRKVGPLPLWAWGAIAVGGLLVGLIIRRRLAGQTAASSGGVTSGAVDTGTGSYPDIGGATSGGASAGGAGSSGIAGIDPGQYVNDVLASFQSGQSSASSLYQMGVQFAQSNGGYAAPGDPSANGGAAPSGAPTGQTSTPSASVLASQTAAGVLAWGGQRFTTKAGFQKWTKAHGTTVTKELAKYPAARKIYAGLK